MRSRGTVYRARNPQWAWTPVFHAADPTLLRATGATEADLACPTWEADMLEGSVAASQRLADRLIAQGYLGMLVRSFAAGAGETDLNLVMWRWGDEWPARVVLIDEEDRLARP